MNSSEILIIGAGPVGLSLALALVHQGRVVRLVDRSAPFSRPRADARVIALSYGSRQFLQQWIAWPEEQAHPITHIHVSQCGGIGQTRFDRREGGCCPGYTIALNDLNAAQMDAARHIAQKTGRLTWHENTIARRNPDHVTWQLHTTERNDRHADDEATCDPALVIHAEGHDDQEHDAWRVSYDQEAVVCPLQLRPQALNPLADEHWAWERFTRQGPLALLPVRKGYVMIMAVTRAEARLIRAMTHTRFMERIEKNLGLYPGTQAVSDVGERHFFPLYLRLRKTIATTREVWVGNVAQTLHPVSGQGLNLGLRDAAVLAEALSRQDRRDAYGLHDPTDYALRRWPDRAATALFTDALVRTFTFPGKPMRLARDAGMITLDLCAPMRRFFAHRLLWGTHH